MLAFKLEGKQVGSTNTIGTILYILNKTNIVYSISDYIKPDIYKYNLQGIIILRLYYSLKQTKQHDQTFLCLFAPDNEGSRIHNSSKKLKKNINFCVSFKNGFARTKLVNFVKYIC